MEDKLCENCQRLKKMLVVGIFVSPRLVDWWYFWGVIFFFLSLTRQGLVVWGPVVCDSRENPLKQNGKSGNPEIAKPPSDHER